MTDPPYGINIASRGYIGGNGVDYGKSDWDKNRPSKEAFNLILKAAKTHIIWGGNYFTDFLPH